MGHKGHYGEYTGNAKWSRNHADTKVTKSNYKASERDDAAHIDYLKRDVDYDNKHGHSDENMTADEKHISKLAGDMKYDKEHHGSPAKIVVPKIGTSEKFKKRTDRIIKDASTVVDMDKTIKHAMKWGSAPFAPYRKDPAIGKVSSPAKKAASSGRSGHPRHMQAGADNSGNPNAASPDEYWRKHQQLRHHQSAPTKMNGSPAKHDSPSGRSHIHTKYHTSYEGDATFPEDKEKGGKVVSGTHVSDSAKSQIINKEKKTN